MERLYEVAGKWINLKFQNNRDELKLELQNCNSN